MPDLLERDSLTALRVGGDERLARAELRRQIGRLERELAGLFAEAFGRGRARHRRRRPASPSRGSLDLGELERVRDALAERIADARQALREQRTSWRPRNRELLRADAAAPAELQVGADLPRRRRRARLRRTGTRAPPRPDRDADGLVAGQGLLRMPVSRAACGR